jgi:hypothetical protein
MLDRDALSQLRSSGVVGDQCPETLLQRLIPGDMDRSGRARMSVIARLEGARATKIEGRQLEAGHGRLTRRVPHVA